MMVFKGSLSLVALFLSVCLFFCCSLTHAHEQSLPEITLSEDATDTFIQSHIQRLHDITYFVVSDTDVSLSPTLTNAGVSRDSIQDYFRLQLKNNFKDVPLVKDQDWKETDEPTAKKELGVMGVHILGHYDRGGRFSWLVSLGIPNQITSDSISTALRFGYCHASLLEDSLKDAVKKLVEQVAIDYYKAKGVL